MKLIIQGKSFSKTDFSSFSEKISAKDFVQMAENAWKFNEVEIGNKDQILKMAADKRLDAAYLPDDFTVSHFKLLAMDMDSTFIQIECIDEIADYCGLKDKVAAITEASMRGEIDFNESLTKRVALLKGLDAKVLESVYQERLILSPGAEIMLSGLKTAGIKTLLVSGGFTFFTDKLKERFDLDFTRANTLEIVNGKLTGKIVGSIVNAEEKALTLKKACAQLNIMTSQTIAMGDGANDLLMMQESGLSIAYHAKPKVKEKALVTFDYVGLDGVLNLLS